MVRASSTARRLTLTRRTWRPVELIGDRTTGCPSMSATSLMCALRHYLRCGNVSARSSIMTEDNRGRFGASSVISICNGFRSLRYYCRSALARNNRTARPSLRSAGWTGAFDNDYGARRTVTIGDRR